MNKKLLFAATVAAMLASCSSDDLSVQTAKQEAQGLENAVSFEALSQRSLTRAGYAGAMDNDQLKDKGFGVFGYYTDLNEYDQTSTPNFMYNQKVSGAGWTYSPIKYWPNEYGSNAQSDDVDKLTFFAYAPYTENAPATGKVTGDDQVGITGFTRATAAGDPYVKYVGSLDPTKCVDLCWGVADPNQNVTWNIIQGGSQTMTAGMPWMNVQRPQKSLGQKMKFFFKHALSQLNVQIDADVNTDTHGAGAEVDSKSKVYVRSITFNGFAMKGALNLNNEDANTPNWKGYNCSNEPIVAEEYTIYDGMKDGKEGTGYKASNEKVTGLNEKIIQDKKWAESAEGVTKTAKNLFNSTTVDAPIYVIPTGDNMNVTIVYDIETKDDKLAGTVSDNETNGVSIENKISKTITLTSGDAMKLEAGKKYTINLHLGLSQVEFDAKVEDWDDTAAAGEAWLPGNGAGDVYTTNISLDQTTLNKTVGDADVTLNATVTPANATDPVTWSSSNPAVATVDQDGKVTFVGAGDAVITAASGGKSVDCTVHVDAATPSTFSTLSELKANVATADNSYLGYFVKADGSISTDNTDAIGIVAYYGNAAVDESAADSRILVLATADASGSAMWKTSYTGGESAYNDPDALNGIAFTNAYGDNSEYPAAQAAKGYSATRPTGASIWFLPSKGQWTKMIDAGHTGIISGFYWSSTELADFDDRAWVYSFDYSFWDDYLMDYDDRVRAAFAY